jgi:prolipoprotein diacylglyceryltransferase
MEHWSEFIQDPIAALSDPFSGLTFFGGLIFGGVAVLWYAARNGVHWRIMLDVGAPAMMLAYGIGRMGCHFSGDGDWGIVNLSDKPGWLSWLPDWAWAYHYPNNVLGQILVDPVWPTPMYEVIMALALFLVIWKLRTRVKAAGALFGFYLIFSGLERYIIEKIRVNPDYTFLGLEFTQAELISVVFVLLGSFMIWYFGRLEKQNPIPAEHPAKDISPEDQTETEQEN